MYTVWQTIIVVFFHTFVFNEINCAWWDDEDDATRILYGDRPAKIRDWPHTVSIVADIGINESKLLCGGFNIGEFENHGIVLTAGSCVNLVAKGFIPKHNLFVVSNSEYWNCKCGGNVVDGILSWRLHPEYRELVIPYIGAFSENDVGLFVLKGRWKGVYNRLALEGPIKIDVPSDAWINSKVRTMGWGYTDLANKATEDLRLAENLVIISGEECHQTYYKEYFPNNSYCIKSEDQPGKGPCAHGQGGPVFRQNEVSELHHLNYLLLGLISTAPVCGDPNKPTIVVNTSAYIPFITDLSWFDKLGKIGSGNGKKWQQSAPIGKDWKCKKSPNGGKMCCTSNKTKCVGVKLDGSWWWIENGDGDFNNDVGNFQGSNKKRTFGLGISFGIWGGWWGIWKNACCPYAACCY